MDAITETALRNNLDKTLDQVCTDHMPITITRSNAQSVVVLSLEDYQALAETAHLIQSPKNRKRLLESIAELESGQGLERDLIE
jgi:antitoxin YefM